MTDRETIDMIGRMVALQEDELRDIKELAQRVDDPTTVGLLIAILIEERRRTNRILEQLLKEIRSLKTKGKETEISDLSEADEKIINLVRERGMVTAEDVKTALGYKGLNGASARLNSLYKRGILQKVRKGRKVYFALA